MRRSLLLAAALTTLTLTAASGPTSPAGTVDPGPVITHINALRADNGLPPLTPDGRLAAVAARWTTRMATTQSLTHNPGLRQDITGWALLGENVGRSPTFTQLDAAFDASPEHRANELGPYTTIGAAAVRDSNGELWVTIDLEQPTPPPPPIRPAAQPAHSPPPQPATTHPTCTTQR
jgi:uncharacterized protein YkwD